MVSEFSPSQTLRGDPPEVTRRDFVYIATGASLAIGGLLASWPLVAQMEPSSDVLAAGGPINVDVSSISPGQQILVMWRARPVFIVHRTGPILSKLRSPDLLALLRDPASNEFQQPQYAKNWCRSIRPEFLVLVGVCTHLGCIPTFEPTIGAVSQSWPGGYLCHCHGSKYDLAGRVFRGVPAPYNLPVPPYHFEGESTVVIGENPKGEAYSLSAIEQI